MSLKNNKLDILGELQKRNLINILGNSCLKFEVLVFRKILLIYFYWTIIQWFSKNFFSQAILNF